MAAPLPAELARCFPAPDDFARTPVALAQVIPGGHMAASQAIVEQIESARERLDVTNPYLTDGDVVDRIIGAAQRGVRVRVALYRNSEIAMIARSRELAEHVTLLQRSSVSPGRITAVCVRGVSALTWAANCSPGAVSSL
jgi:phosphatidylserine/phosphatidylglycerophosphate/cardiolipin synthase-like enzyme